MFPQVDDLVFASPVHAQGGVVAAGDVHTPNSQRRILVLDHGERIAFGTPEEIGNHDRVAEVYFG